jgi:hypothetical protein
VGKFKDAQLQVLKKRRLKYNDGIGWFENSRESASEGWWKRNFRSRKQEDSS